LQTPKVKGIVPAIGQQIRYVNDLSLLRKVKKLPRKQTGFDVTPKHGSKPKILRRKEMKWVPKTNLE
jgi:hypothetical protein